MYIVLTILFHSAVVEVFVDVVQQVENETDVALFDVIADEVRRGSVIAAGHDACGRHGCGGL